MTFIATLSSQALRLLVIDILRALKQTVQTKLSVFSLLFVAIFSNFLIYHFSAILLGTFQLAEVKFSHVPKFPFMKSLAIECG